MKLRIYLGALRANFLPASVVPFLTGMAYAYANGYGISPLKTILGLAGVMSAHIAANVFNDYFDHLSGADELNTGYSPFFGGSRMIQKGLVSSREIMLIALFFSACSVISGIIIYLLTKDPVFIIIMLTTGVLGVEYTAPPFRLVYNRLGEIVIFLLFGVLLVSGSFYLFAGRFTAGAVLAGLPVSFLITAVIICNEVPDSVYDVKAGKNNLITLFGRDKGYIVFGAIICLSLISAVVNVIRHVFPPDALFVCGAYVMAVGPCLLLKNGLKDPGLFEKASRSTIMLHLLAGAGFTFTFLIK